MADAKIRFLFDNRLDKTTTILTASTANASYPVANLQDTVRKKTWRTTSITSQSLIIDLGSAKAVTAITMVEFNFSDNASVRIMASALADFSVLDYDATQYIWSYLGDPLFGYGYGESGYGERGYGGFAEIPTGFSFDSLFIHYISNYLVIPLTGYEYGEAGYGEEGYGGYTQVPTGLTSLSKRYWKLEFTDENQTDAYLEIGRVFIGTYLELGYNFEYGWQEGIIDPSIIRYTLENTPYTNEKTIYHNLNLSLNFMTDDERQLEIERMVQIAGLKKDMFVSLFPSPITLANPLKNPLTTWYGRIEGSIVSTNFHDIWSKMPLVFRESR